MFRLAHNILHLIWPGWTDYDPAKKLEAAVKETGIAFIHIPKCAGNSVGEYLYGFGPGHRTWRWFRRLDAHSVAVIRDPVDRFLSACDYLRTPGRDLSNRVIARLYLSGDINQIARRLSNPHMRQFFHFQTQAYYVTDKGKVMVDELVPFEKLKERFPDLPSSNKTKGARTPREALDSRSLEILREVYAEDYRLRELALNQDADRDAV